MRMTRGIARLLFLGAAALSGCSSGVSPGTVGDAGSPSDAGRASVPSAPRDVVASATVGGATVTWSAPDSTGGSPITGYTVSITPATPSAQISVSGLGATVAAGVQPGHLVAAGGPDRHLHRDPRRQLRLRHQHGPVGSRGTAAAQLALPHRQAGLLRVEPVAVGGSARGDQGGSAACTAALRLAAPLSAGLSVKARPGT